MPYFKVIHGFHDGSGIGLRALIRPLPGACYTLPFRRLSAEVTLEIKVDFIVESLIQALNVRLSLSTYY